MRMIPADAAQIHIHTLLLVQTGTIFTTIDGSPTIYYAPITEVSFIRNGLSCVIDEPFYHSFGFFDSLENAWLDIRNWINECLSSGITIIVEPKEACHEIIYKDKGRQGRIYTADEMLGPFEKARRGVRTFQEIWAEELFEFALYFTDKDEKGYTFRWIEAQDDLVSFVQRKISAGYNFADIQNITKGKTLRPKIPQDYARTYVLSSYVISLKWDKDDRKTYLSSCINTGDEMGRILSSYAVSSDDAHHFIDEDTALDVALSLSERDVIDSFEIEEIPYCNSILEDTWIERL